MIAGHFAFNYKGVRGVALRSLNKQRTGITWTSYRSRALGLRDSKSKPHLTPEWVASRERIFQRAGTLRDALSDEILGHCIIGTSLTSLLSTSGPAFHEYFKDTIACFKDEKYILCFDPSYIESPKGLPLLHICLKTRCTPQDQLKGWVHALELARACATATTGGPASLISASCRGLDDAFGLFIQHMRNMGWDVKEGALMSGAPGAVLVSVSSIEVESGDDEDGLESKKDI